MPVSMRLAFFPMLLCNIRCCHSISVYYYASLDAVIRVPCAVMQVSMLLLEFRMLLCKSPCCYPNSVCYYASLDAVIRVPYAIMQVSMLLFELRMLLFEFRFFSRSSLGSNGQRWCLICRIMINYESFILAQLAKNVTKLCIVKCSTPKFTGTLYAVMAEGDQSIEGECMLIFRSIIFDIIREVEGSNSSDVRSFVMYIYNFNDYPICLIVSSTSAHQMLNSKLKD